MRDSTRYRRPSRTSRLLDQPCNRWQPDEVLDMAAIMLMSRHWPRGGEVVGNRIAVKFSCARGGRGRSPTFGQLPRDPAVFYGFLDRHPGPRWNGRHRDSRWPLTRRVANAGMLEAIDAFRADEGTSKKFAALKGGIIERHMSAEAVAFDEARERADELMHRLLRCLKTPWRRDAPGRAKHPGLQFTWQHFESARARLTSTLGPRVSDRQVAEAIRLAMPANDRPSLGTIQNRISKLRGGHREQLRQ